MKAISILILSLVAAGVCSAAGPRKKKAAAQQPVAEKLAPVPADTFSYAMGVAQSNGLKNYVIQNLKVDTAYYAEFIRGLREGVLDGTIEVIATDHAPHTAEEKARGLAGSAMGVVGLECAFPLLYTYLVKPGVLTLERLVALMSLNPRRIFRLGGGLHEAGGDLGVLALYVDAVEEVAVHEIAVALVMRAVEADVLVEVEALRLREAELPLRAQPRELGIEAEGRRARREAEHRVRLFRVSCCREPKVLQASLRRGWLF